MALTDEIKQHLENLDHEDIHAREVARWLLASSGQEAVPDLIEQLKTDNERCRWEAARLLGEIQGKAAAEALVEALNDQSLDVHGAAAEALIRHGHEAVLPLLEGLVHHFNSLRFRRGAYHVLHSLQKSHDLEPHVLPVLRALHSADPTTSAPWAAERAIEYLKFQR